MKTPRPKKPTLKMQLLAANEEIATLRKDNRDLEKSRDDWAATADRRRKHIATFKAEHLELMLAGAELRGYIQRTLEDDAVREAGSEPEATGMTGVERDQAHRAIERDFRNSQQQPKRRTGPSAMTPAIVVSPGAGDSSLMESWRSGRTATAAPEQPLPWHERT